jgi:hypothetical protein
MPNEACTPLAESVSRIWLVYPRSLPASRVSATTFELVVNRATATEAAPEGTVVGALVVAGAVVAGAVVGALVVEAGAVVVVLVVLVVLVVVGVVLVVVGVVLVVVGVVGVVVVVLGSTDVVEEVSIVTGVASRSSAQADVATISARTNPARHHLDGPRSTLR